MNNQLWIEKYRPKNFKEIIGQNRNIELLEKIADVLEKLWENKGRE